jgi:hypothetical protein
MPKTAFVVHKIDSTRKIMVDYPWMNRTEVLENRYLDLHLQL